MTCLVDRVLSEAGMMSHVRDVFCIHLVTMYDNFQEKFCAEISGKIFQTFHCSNVTKYNEKFETFSRKSLQRFFFLKISIQCAKVFTKNVLKIEVM